MLVADIQSERLKYEQRFGYIACCEPVHDPVQTAWVQFLKLPGDRVYLELVAPDRSDSKFTNAMSKGVALHHLCYETEDIEATCGGLRKTGMTLVRAPVSAAAFGGRRIAWLIGRDRILVELVEGNMEGQLL